MGEGKIGAPDKPIREVTAIKVAHVGYCRNERYDFFIHFVNRKLDGY